MPVVSLLLLVERLYEVFENSDKSKLDPEEVKKIKTEYNTLIENYCAEIKSVTRIIISEVESPLFSKTQIFLLKQLKS
jgi:NTE family protein